MKASVFVGVSLDGFIARPDGSFDFLPQDGGEPHGYEEFFSSIDALQVVVTAREAEARSKLRGAPIESGHGEVQVGAIQSGFRISNVTDPQDK